MRPTRSHKAYRYDRADSDLRGLPSEARVGERLQVVGVGVGTATAVIADLVARPSRKYPRAALDHMLATRLREARPAQSPPRFTGVAVTALRVAASAYVAFWDEESIPCLTIPGPMGELVSELVDSVTLSYHADNIRPLTLRYDTQSPATLSACVRSCLGPLEALTHGQVRWSPLLQCLTMSEDWHLVPRSKKLRVQTLDTPTATSFPLDASRSVVAVFHHPRSVTTVVCNSAYFRARGASVGQVRAAVATAFADMRRTGLPPTITAAANDADAFEVQAELSLRASSLGVPAITARLAADAAAAYAQRVRVMATAEGHADTEFLVLSHDERCAVGPLLAGAAVTARRAPGAAVLSVEIEPVAVTVDPEWSTGCASASALRAAESAFPGAPDVTDSDVIELARAIQTPPAEQQRLAQMALTRRVPARSILATRYGRQALPMMLLEFLVDRQQSSDDVDARDFGNAVTAYLEGCAHFPEVFASQIDRLLFHVDEWIRRRPFVSSDRSRRQKPRAIVQLDMSAYGTDERARLQDLARTCPPLATYLKDSPGWPSLRLELTATSSYRCSLSDARVSGSRSQAVERFCRIQ
jgi:hypothetical protein